MSDTPRTDKLLSDQEFDRVPYDDACIQLKELCRELESELNKSKNIERQPPLDAAACSRGLFAIADGFIYRAGKTNDHTLCVWDVADILRTAADAINKLETERDETGKLLRIAVGMLSATPQFQGQHPEQVLKFIEEATK